jgi:glutamine amidotransferase
VKVAIVDLGCGNTGSVKLAFERFGVTAAVTSAADEIAGADRVVLPGVGTAGFAMRNIDRLGLRGLLISLEQQALGICLGMQLLFERSEEAGVECLGKIAGKVRSLTPSPGRPVPHMGWSSIQVRDPKLDLLDGDYVYFAHSFAAGSGPATVATTEYGRTIAAVVRQGNWLGAQFHPERSGEAGARFLKAFLQ